MRDFTLESYKEYILLLKNVTDHFLTFEDFMASEEKKESFCLIRHDVDRKPQNALKMAVLEKELGVKSTYYFRYKPQTFKPAIFSEIAGMGHEIGYHYENLSDCNGHVENALADFEHNLAQFRKHVKISTISMHGRPLKKFDNRDLWRDGARHKLLKEKFGLCGEVYLDIDYTDIAYINDTGRNWTSGKSNIRDKVHSVIEASFRNSSELKQYLRTNPHPKICFQIHPERWDDQPVAWANQYVKDSMINSAKRIFNLLK